MGWIRALSRVARRRILFALAAGVSVLAALPLHAELVFKEPVANAGIVYSGQVLKHRFIFVNQGSQTAEIREAKASCGCLAPRLSQTSYKPGEEGTLELEVRTLSQAEGPHAWTVRLEYQSGNQIEQTLLQLNATVRTEVRVQPAAIVLFADRAAGHEITITDLRPKPLTIIAVRASSPHLKTRLSEPEHDRAGHGLRKLSLEVARDLPEGRHEEAVTIYADDPKYAELRVPVTLVKRSQQRLAATPSAVLLTGASGKPLPSRIVLIRDNDNQSVKIDHIMVDDPAVTCRWAPGPNTLATLKIQVDQTRIQGGSLESAVHVRISKPIRETLTIPVKCVVK